MARRRWGESSRTIARDAKDALPACAIPNRRRRDADFAPRVVGAPSPKVLRVNPFDLATGEDLRINPFDLATGEHLRVKRRGCSRRALTAERLPALRYRPSAGTNVSMSPSRGRNSALTHVSRDDI